MPHKTVEEYMRAFSTQFISDGVPKDYPTLEKGKFLHTASPFAIEQFIRTILTQIQEETRKEVYDKARRVFIDGCDWAEWGMNDEDAGKQFDEEMNYHKI